jgi:RHS repeat-associated protein
MSTVSALAARARQRLSPGAVPRWLGAVLAVALAVTGLQAAGAGPAMAMVAGPGGVASKDDGPAPVSNAFAMGGGVGGSIDQRTGAFQASVPLVNIAGRGGDGLSLTLTYDQALAEQGDAGDRFGLGAGWTLGVPWVDTLGGLRVYPASGGSYDADTDSPTGLHDYPLRDLAFADAPGTTTPPPGVAKRPYEYTLTYLDGTVDRFDDNGNLIEQVDRFGNAIDLTWQQSGSWWQPTSVTDSYGQVTTFDYGTAAEVKVIAPPSAEKITATTTLDIADGQLQTVTDPLKQQTSFGYTTVAGLPGNDELLQTVTSPTGEQTTVSYASPDYQPDLVTVDTVDFTDPDGTAVLPELHFDINPPANSNQHNYTGYPDYNNKGPNGLFDSGDTGYRYTTELTNGTSAVDATYNSLQLLVDQQVTLHPGGDATLNQDQTYTYPDVNSVDDLPPNYSKPTSVTVVYGDPSIGSGATRTVTTASQYNDKGLQTSATNGAGTTTTTSYGSYGLPLTQTVTGEHGATSVTTDTLSTDGKTVKTVTTAVGPTAKSVTARTVASYDYNKSGQVSGESVAWAPGAKPPGDSGGPDQVDSTQQISTDTAADTQTDVVTTAAGTPQAASTTTVTDLVTGQVLSQTSPGNLTTSYTYDALGRQLTMTAPGGQTTTSSYPTPRVTDTTAPSGLETQTTTDVTGRTVKVTDNVSGEELVKDPTARTVQTDKYASDGTQLTTTTPAGTETTTFDPLGRPVQVVQPGGITEADAYNDVANTQKVSLVPAGAKLTSPVSVTKDGFDDLNQPTSSSTSYTDATPQAPTAETYDGLGRVTSYSASGLTATPDYSGAGGLQSGTTLTPGDTADFPGQPASTATDNTMTGALTSKTLTGQAKTGKRQVKAPQPAPGTTYTYDAAGRVHTATTADKAVTTYTYTAAGQIATVTQPSGTKTTYSYDGKTGRLAEVDVHSGDGRTQQTGYAYYPDTGRVKSVFDPSHPDDAIGYTYDADGHVIEVDYPDGTSTKASYDDNGQLATSTDITGAVTTYTYNAGGTCGPARTDLCSAVQKRGGTTLASVAYTYDPMDRVHTITRGNGVTTTIDYTDASQVKTETVRGADAAVLRTDGYTYDGHGNVATHTITSTLPAPAAPGRAAAPRTRARASATATTTAYSYDAYNRLISSKVYSGATATGTPTTTTAYTLDPAGNVTGQDTTTGSTTTHIVNTISPGGELTARAVNGTATEQKFDADGNVTKDLAGDSYSYDPDGEQASVTTPAGITTVYTYWPDHTRRTATTTVGGVAHVITYHYATNGKIANDTYTGGGTDTVTASYLMGVNREARTLLASTGTGPGAAQTTGPGTGYYLTDAHGSVIAMIDATGQATASYAYGDYGAPAGPSPALLPAPAAGPAGNAAVSPFSYDGYYTNPSTGTQYLPARSYDPAQGRFLSADAADQFNRYQAFNTNPIVNTDPTGQLAVPQILTDFCAFALFLAFGVLSAGAAAPVLAAVAVGEEAATAITASVALNAVSALTNIGAAATSLTLTANDAAELSGGGFLTSTEKDNLNTASFALGAVAGITSFVAGGLDLAGGAEEAASESEATASESGATASTGLGPQEIDAEGFNSLFGENASQTSPDIFGGDEGLESSDNEDTEPSRAGMSQSAEEDSSEEGPAAGASPEEGGQIPEVPDNADAAGQLQTTQATPSTLDQAGDQFAAVLQDTGYNANLNPTAQPFAQTQALPGGPSQTSAEMVPTSPEPAVNTTNAVQGPNPLAEAATTGVQNAVDGNTPEATPEQPVNLLGENTSAPSVGFDSDSGLPGDSELPENEFVLTFGF